MVQGLLATHLPEKMYCGSRGPRIPSRDFSLTDGLIRVCDALLLHSPVVRSNVFLRLRVHAELAAGQTSIRCQIEKRYMPNSVHPKQAASRRKTYLKNTTPAEKSPILFSPLHMEWPLA